MGTNMLHSYSQITPPPPLPLHTHDSTWPHLLVSISVFVRGRWLMGPGFADRLFFAEEEEEVEEEALIVVIHITPCLCECLLIDGVSPLHFFGGNNPADVHSFEMRRLLPLPSLSVHYRTTGTRETSTQIFHR